MLSVYVNEFCFLSAMCQAVAWPRLGLYQVGLYSSRGYRVAGDTYR